MSELKDLIKKHKKLEIDFANTTITGEIDSVAIGDVGASSTYTTSSSYPETKSY